MPTFSLRFEDSRFGVSTRLSNLGPLASDNESLDTFVIPFSFVDVSIGTIGEMVTWFDLLPIFDFL